LSERKSTSFSTPGGSRGVEERKDEGHQKEDRRRRRDRTGEGRRRVYEDEEEEDTVKPCTTLLGSERLITSHPLADSLPV
jgi:hypothetical protein